MWEHIVIAGFAAREVMLAMSMFLPPPREADPRWYVVVYAAVNAVAYNFLHARNADRGR